MKHLLIVSFALIQLGTSRAQRVFFESGNPAEVIRPGKAGRELIYTYQRNKDSVLVASILYDSLGNEKEKKLTKAWGFAEGLTTHSYVYNTKGKISKAIAENKGLKTVGFSEYEYDEAGNEIAAYYYNKDTTSLNVWQKSYNIKNQLVQLVMKIDNNDAFVSRRYYYDVHDKFIKEEAFDPQGKITFSYIYEYDSLLNKKTTYLENQEGKKIESISFYNNDKQCIKQMKAENGRAVTDPNDLNETREFIYNPDKTIFEFDVYIDGKKQQTNRHYYLKN